MKNLKYYRPVTINELKEQISIPGARILAGGTDIVPRMRQGEFSAPILVDTSGVQAMRFIEDHGSEISLGALTTYQEMADSALLRNVNPALVTAADSIGCLHTRRRGTLGGDIASASSEANILLPLLVFDATVSLQSLDEERRIPLEQFLIGPGDTGLRDGEFIHSITFAPLFGNWGVVYIKIENRSEMAESFVNTSVLVLLGEKGKIGDVRVAFGALCPKALRCRIIEKSLIGKEAGSHLLKEIIRSSQEEIGLALDNESTGEYLNHAAAVVMHNALEAAVEQAEMKRCERY